MILTPKTNEWIIVLLAKVESFTSLQITTFF
jgi:hypothetical protein